MIGSRVLSINKIEASAIIEIFSQYKASDGINDAFAKQYFQFASSRIISLLLNNPATYEVLTNKGAVKLNATQKPMSNNVIIKTTENHISNNDNFLSFQQGKPILRFKNFTKSDLSFIRKSFKIINSNNKNFLIIDLRQNTGGNRNAAIELTKYLVDTAFNYSILQPKLQTRKYVNRKGKQYLFLSKLKYNVGSFFKGRKTDLGREYTYSFKAIEENHFKGKIHVLTDGFTASASTMVTSWLRQFSNAKFIGSQAGGGYNGNNGGSFPLLTLPYSKIEIKFPAYRLILDKNSTFNQGILPALSINTETNYNDLINIINGNF